MKKTMIILAAIFMLACNDEKSDEPGKKSQFSDLAAANLKGDISSIEETPFKSDSTGKVGDMDSCCISVSEYNENGNNVKTISKDSMGKITRESVITHHPNGLFKSARDTEDGKNKGGFETRVDDKGNYTWAGEIDSNGKDGIYYLSITQNEAGEVTGWKQYDKDSVFRQSGEIIFDGHKFMSSTIKDSLGNVKNTTKAAYNDKGEQTEITNTDVLKGNTVTVTKYTYETHDEMGNWTQRTTWNDKGKATGVVKRVITFRKK
jgi:hypothetical protein